MPFKLWPGLAIHISQFTGKGPFIENSKHTNIKQLDKDQNQSVSRKVRGGATLQALIGVYLFYLFAARAGCKAHSWLGPLLSSKMDKPDPQNTRFSSPDPMCCRSLSHHAARDINQISSRSLFNQITTEVNTGKKLKECKEFLLMHISLAQNVQNSLPDSPL